VYLYPAFRNALGSSERNTVGNAAPSGTIWVAQ
jgi:hypothetical protein